MPPALPTDPPATAAGGAAGSPEGREALLARLDRLERELRAARDDAAAVRQELQTAQRAGDNLLSMLGHELRNPVGAIVSALDVLESGATDSAAAGEARAIVRRQARKLADLMNELHDARRVITGRVASAAQPLDLAAAVVRVQRSLQWQDAASADRLDVRVEPSWIQGDVARIDHVLRQLLAHALRAASPRERVAVQVCVREGQACLAVQDTAAALAAALLPHAPGQAAGDPLPASHAGTDGIGLALVPRLLELHGGSIATDSGPGGARLTLRLPAVQPPAGQDTGLLPPARRRRVLVVEDRTDLLVALRSELELDGHAVTTAVDGIEGLTRVLKEQPEVSLVDIGLPGLTGHEVARHARAAGYAGRMVAMSGYSGDADARLARQSGFDAYLVKPVDRAQLRACLGDD